MAEDWASLPPDLLGLILRNLTAADHLRFAAAWNSAWNSAVRSRLHRPKPEPPWLLLPAAASASASAKLLPLSDPTKIRTVPLPLPPIRSRSLLASSCGRLITGPHDPDSDSGGRILLLNPLTRAQTAIPTPHCSGDLIKAALYEDQTLALVHGPDRRLSLAKSADNYTNWIRIVLARYVADVIFHKGRLITVNNSGELQKWDGEDPASPPRTFTGRCRGLWADERQLVESATGEELFVIWKKMWACKFEVYLVDMERCRVQALEEIGDNLLFVSKGHAVSASAAVFPELRRNCLYFAEEHDAGVCLRQRPGVQVFVFDMKEETVRPLGTSASQFHFTRAIWFTPTLF